MTAPQVVRRLLLGAAMLFAFSAVRASELVAVEISPRATADYNFSGWRSDGPLPPALTVPLELGDEIHGATLRLISAQVGTQYRVRVQYETSLVLSAAGPHLDLVDWKHCVSEWQLAQASGALSFVLPAPTEEQASCFPAYTPAELAQAVRDLGQTMGDPAMAEAWIDDMQQKTSVIGVSPVVAISQVRVRVEALLDGRWVDVTMVAFLPAMGC